MGTVIKIDASLIGEAVRKGFVETLQGLVRTVQRTVKLEGPRHIAEAIETTTPFKPVDRGTYRREWRFENTEKGVAVFNPLVYAPVLEMGRRPGGRPPPFKAILDWVLRKGLANRPSEAGRIARAIQLKLARKGMAGRHVLARATENINVAVKRDINEWLRKTPPVRP